MTKIFIFGDSFSCRTKDNWSWVNLLEKDFVIYNNSVPGSKTSDSLNKLQNLISSEKISQQDFIIVCLSDKSREYMVITDPNWDKKCTEIYTDVLIKFKTVLKDFKHIVLWGFPSDYMDTGGWLDTRFSYLDKKDYKYFFDFSNEIRPALIYFSRQETKNIMNNKKLSKFFSQDTRPNHIGRIETHKKIYNAILKFLNNNLTGCINLEE